MSVVPDPPPSEVLVVIPARGGSKGLPRKNALPLAGRPLIAHSIDAARRARLAGRVAVSTDDAEIAAIARRFGAEVVDRPAELSGDAASSEAALLHALDVYEGVEGYRPELLVFLQCTSPLTEPEDIDGTIRAMLAAGADSALAVAPFHHFLWRGGDAGARGVNHDATLPRQRRQDREPEYLETGAVYVARVEGFRRAGRRFFGKTVFHPTPSDRCIEIDDEREMAIAELLIRRRDAARTLELLPRPVEALVMDFDGVMTDNKVVVREDRVESVVCDRGDGMGIGFLKKRGIPMLVLSKEVNPVVRARCEKLGLTCLHAIDDKPPAMMNWLREVGASPERTVYVGNDINDAECMKLVGCAAAPRDAHPDVLPFARILLTRDGGRGAVRELCDAIAANADRSAAGRLDTRASPRL